MQTAGTTTISGEKDHAAISFLSVKQTGGHVSCYLVQLLLYGGGSPSPESALHVEVREETRCPTDFSYMIYKKIMSKNPFFLLVFVLIIA